MTTLSLSGNWTGVYDYPVASMDPVPFFAELTDVAGVVWGTTTEPRTGAFGGVTDELTANLSGYRSRREIRFEKRYDPVIEGGENAIHYAGIISEDGNRIEGKWSISDGFAGFSGPFVMDRAKGAKADATLETEAELDLVETGPSTKGEKPSRIIFDQKLGFRDLLKCHFFSKPVTTARRIWIAADRRETVPQISAREIGSSHAKPLLEIKADLHLRTRMPFHRRAQIPFKRALSILFHPQSKRIDHSNQLFSIRIARLRSGSECFLRLCKSACLDQIAGFLDFTLSSKRQQKQDQGKYTHRALLGLALSGLASVPVQADALGPKDFGPIDAKKAALGQLLFYDPILSGNRNISCGTCHNHDFASTDGIALGLGEGGVGVGPNRLPGAGATRVRRRTARNVPALFNLGARDIRVLFHDGRISRSDAFGNSFDSPAERHLPDGLDSLLAVQALFPMVSAREMAGDASENEIGQASAQHIETGWAILAARIRTIPEYVAEFVEAFEDVDASSDITISHVVNAIAAFIDAEWRSYDAPFDRGELSLKALRGMELFKGKAGCESCHSGPLFTDQEFYALAIPQFGPGRTRNFDPYARDLGRMGASDAPEDAYRFRTPSLRNVTLTAPYGHNGAYPTLEGIIRHHLNPLGADWSPELVKMPRVAWLADTDFIVQSDAREMTRQRARIDIEPRDLSDAEIGDLIAFLNALTGGTASYGRLGKPQNVPSGLKVD